LASSNSSNVIEIINSPNHNVIVDYGFYQVNYNCDKRGYNYVTYSTVPDTGNNPRVKPFELENALKQHNCNSQKTTSTYRLTNEEKAKNGGVYHRGHGNHSNIWDHSVKLMSLTNRMTNVVPQDGVQNTRGLWRKLEERVECARDKTTVHVWLGNDWGTNRDNDYFVDTHGVETPDYLWRIHVYDSEPNVAYAWYFPNDKIATLRDENKYRVNVEFLKNKTSGNYNLTLPKGIKDAQGNDPYKYTKCSLK
jgi:endonuclease G